MLLILSILLIVTLSFGLKVVPEDMNSIRTVNDVWPMYKIFYPIESDTIRFSVHAGHEAWIGLTSEPHPASPRYEIVLGANGNKKVIIMKSRRMAIAKTNITVLSATEHRGFWIKLENRHIPNLKISVGREGEVKPFIGSIVPEHVQINYFALATIGDDICGNWRVKGLDRNSRVIADIKSKEVTTISNMGVTRKYGKLYYNMKDNIIRFWVKANFGASLFFWHTESLHFFEFVISDREVKIMKDDIIIKQFGNEQFLDEEHYYGYWITFTKSPYDYWETVLSIGRLGSKKSIVSVVVAEDHRIPITEPNRFSISTNTDKPLKNGTWHLYI